MPVSLITGVPGHGKTQVAIREILKFVSENDKLEKQGEPRRPIFCDIAGINEKGHTPIPDVEPIPFDEMIWFGGQASPFIEHKPDNLHCPPIGSIFVFDECQFKDWIRQRSGALSSDWRIRSMETHRHAGLDIILIAQGANYIHSHLHDLISPHYHVERPLNLPFTNLFTFNRYQKQPSSTTSKKHADDQINFGLGKKYGQYYKSSAQHNMKAKIPRKLIWLLGIFVCLIVATVYNYMQTDFAKDDDIADAQQAIKSVKTDSLSTVSATTNDALMQQYLPAHIAPVVYYEDVRPAMVIESSDGTCRTYNKFGEPLNVALKDCQLMSDKPAYIPRSRITPDFQREDSINAQDGLSKPDDSSPIQL